MKTIYVNDLLRFNRSLYVKIFNACWEKFFREVLHSEDDWLSLSGTFMTDTLVITTDFIRVNIEQLFKAANAGVRYTPVLATAEYNDFQLNYDYCGGLEDSCFPPHEICEMVLTFGDFLYKELTSVEFMTSLNDLLAPVGEQLMQLKSPNGIVGYWISPSFIHSTVWDGRSCVEGIERSDFDAYLYTGSSTPFPPIDDRTPYFYWRHTANESIVHFPTVNCEELSNWNVMPEPPEMQGPFVCIMRGGNSFLPI